MAKKAIAEMLCGHSVWCTYSGTAGVMRDREYCPECKSNQSVNQYHREQWHSKCRACSYGATHGFAKAYAETAANRHYAKTAHTVDVLWYMTAPPELDLLPSPPENNPILVADDGSIPF